MHMTRPTDVDVHEMSTVIYKSLHYYGVPAFSVVAVSRVLIERNNGCVPSTAPLHWGKPSSLNPLITSVKAAPDGTVTYSRGNTVDMR